MRNIVYKALSSQGSNKRDIYIQETNQQDGITAKTERRCRYFVMGKALVTNINDVEHIANTEFSNLRYKKTHYYVLKNHDSVHNEDNLLCKIAGVLYAMHNEYVYCIAYIHSFKILFKGELKNSL